MSHRAIAPEEPGKAAWGYDPDSSFFDEALTPEGKIRPHWQELVDSMTAVGAEDFARRWQEGRRLVHDNGITYNVYSDPKSTERPWTLDPIPLVIDRTEWAAIEAAIRQRATLLNAILLDLYGPQRLLHDNLLPAELVFRHPGFLRTCHGVTVPGNTYLHMYAADLARSPDGKWWVIADRTQAPSGAGYAVENRLVSSRVLADLFGQIHVRRLGSFFQAYRETLRTLVPRNRDNPRIVLLTPGPYNETYFEHAFMARNHGYTLVEGGDLTVRDNAVFLKTLGGLLQVDLIVRRQDDGFCDPLELREDSILGVPGLMQAIRSGNVTMANALGSGLMESAAPAGFLPGLSRHLLGEELKLPTIATWWCGQDEPLRFVTENLAKLVIKPAFHDSGRHPVFGARLSTVERQKLADELRASPADFVAQEQVALSTVPVWEAGDVNQRHMVLRVYAAISGDSYMVMPGGLTRVTSVEDSLVVSMQRGGGSKDTWVMGDGPVGAVAGGLQVSARVEVSRATFDLPSRVADNLFWLGRYVERLEMALRIARAVLPRLSQDLDAVRMAGVNAGVRVLSSLGLLSGAHVLAKDRMAQLERELLAMIYDSAAPGGLVSILHEVRHIGWLLRDRISTDAWRILNQLEQETPNPFANEALRISGALNFLDRAVIKLSAFGGQMMENVTRGDGWRFLDIGRRLERANEMVELLRNGFGTNPVKENGQLEALLEIADSQLTYRSRYLNSMQADLVLDLLLIDEANPRSVAFQLMRLREHVNELPESQTTGRRSGEWRIALRMLSAVRLAEPADLMRADGLGRLASLEDLLGALASDLRLLSEKLTRAYFTLATPAYQMKTPEPGGDFE
jgi:uncharacterized circularly permuted ATP-grasp superfamily protein/uncharacterized alpha-E superfamily protein